MRLNENRRQLIQWICGSAIECSKRGAVRLTSEVMPFRADNSIKCVSIDQLIKVHSSTHTRTHKYTTLMHRQKLQVRING